MTSSYGIGGKPYMGPVGGGGWQVGPHVLDPLGANGNKPVDAAGLRESWERFKKPTQPSASNTGVKFGPQIPSGGQRVTPVTGVGGSNPIIGNTSKTSPVQGPQQVQGPSPRSQHNVKIKPAQGPRPAPVPTGSQGNRMAGLWGAVTNNPVVKWGGRLFQGANAIDGVIKATQGDWDGVAGNAATGVLTRAVSNPWLAPFALDMMDTQHAGGALYDKDGKSLMPELTAEQKALQAKIRAESGDSFRYTDSPAPVEPETETETETKTEQLESAYLHPDLKGPKGNEVGQDYAPSEPDIQGSGDPKSVGDNPFAIWANKYKGLAEKVKPGQAGYEEIQKALGKDTSVVPASAYGSDLKFTPGGTDAPDGFAPKGGLKSDIEYDGDINYDPTKGAQDFLKGGITALTTSASSFQQPNFDGTSQPIGGLTPTDPQPVQDFENANTNPAEVVGYLGHPLNKQPSAEAEAANAEYGAMKFEFDPVKNMMVRVK